MAKDTKFEFRDNSGAVLSALQSQTMAALEAMGEQAESYAKGLCPHDTGRLKGSITHQSVGSERAVYIGTDVEYATYVEMNDRVRHPNGGQAHYLRDSLTNHANEYHQIAESYLKR